MKFTFFISINKGCQICDYFFSVAGSSDWQIKDDEEI